MPPITLDGTRGITTPTYNGNTTAEYLVPVTGFKNRIINGDMTIDQRNAGASVTPAASTPTYTLDRWLAFQTGASKFSVQQNAGAVTPPVGFSNYLGVTSLAATSVGATDIYQIVQKIEGFNFADLGWGTANAATVTLSFWVRSSLTGTFGGSVRNGADNRSYPFSYSVPVANTWTSISVTIAGDTTGTWVGATNGIGASLTFGLGVGSTYSGTAGAWAGSLFISATGATSVVGTNGATFYITGVQLEVGTQATSFDYLPYGTELALCQRYFCSSYVAGTAVGTITTTGMIGRYTDAAGVYCSVQGFYPVSMRAAPTLTIYGVLAGGTSGQVSGDSANKAGLVAGNGSTTNFFASTNNVSTNAGESIKCNFIANSEL
jgi:hypothetical protein